jgi:hypothetical protein
MTPKDLLDDLRANAAGEANTASLIRRLQMLSQLGADRAPLLLDALGSEKEAVGYLLLVRDQLASAITGWALEVALEARERDIGKAKKGGQ